MNISDTEQDEDDHPVKKEDMQHRYQFPEISPFSYSFDFSDFANESLLITSNSF